jgi:cytochrome P450
LGRIFRHREPETDWATFNWLHAESILDNEPPTHTRLRRLIAGAFGRGHVQRLAPRIEQLAAELLDHCAERVAADGAVDVIEELAEPLPVLVIAQLLGVPDADRHLLRPWSQAIVRMYEVNRTAEQDAAAQRACAEFAAYVEELAADRALHPGEDLLSDLVAARDGTDRLSPRELVATAVLLLNAGHEASVNGFGNGLASLLAATGGEFADPVTLVEEMLRHDSPLHLFERTATRDTAVAGVPIRAGEKIAVLLGAANRDPEVFPEPDAFRPDRDPNPHLAFGAGIHFCVGAPLARLELATSVGLLLGRWPRLHVVEAVRRPTFVLRGYERLAVAPG